MAFSTTVFFEEITCATPACGVRYAIDQAVVTRRRKDGTSFYCPNGHSNYFRIGETEIDRVRAALLRAQSTSDYKQKQLEKAQAEIVSEKRVKTRYKNERNAILQRVAEGVCNCCNRKFVNVARHMKTKHPAFVGIESDKRRAAQKAAPK